MSTRIDTFAEVGSLAVLFRRAFDGRIDLPGDLEERICLLARSKWNELTRPLDKWRSESGMSLPAEPPPGSENRMPSVAPHDDPPSARAGPPGAGNIRRSGSTAYDAGVNRSGTGAVDDSRMPTAGSRASPKSEEEIIEEIWNLLYGGRKQ